jgi:hypothetical protein
MAYHLAIITTGDVARLAGRAPRRLIDVAKEYLT